MAHGPSYGNRLLERTAVDADLYDEIVAITDTPSESDPDDPEAWKELAICSQTDPEIFFPEKGGSTREAKAVCRGCPVRKDCLQAALDRDERFGIWGGYSERERRSMKRRIA